MASVTVALTGHFSSSIGIGWDDNVSLGTTFDLNGQAQVLDSIRLRDMTGFGSIPGQCEINLTTADDRFTPEFEATGRIIFEASDGETVEVMIANADMQEPYVWVPTNSAEVISFVTHVRGLTDKNATLTLTDDPPGTDHAVDAGSVSWAFALPQPSVTHTTPQPIDHAVNAGDVAWVFDLPEPTVTHTPTPQTLTLADFDDTGLTVDAAALLTASAPGTTGNNPYADSDRGGADSPLDGELGLSSTQTVISRIRRHSATELNLNDNDNPSALDIGTYFAAGGDGNDLTLYLQTAADGW